MVMETACKAVGSRFDSGSALWRLVDATSFCYTYSMDRKTKGRLAEIKVLSYFIENGYEVYTPFCDNSKYDLLVYKDRQLQRVSIKFTSAQAESGKWKVGLRQVSRRGNNTTHVDNFDHDAYDLVAAYIGPEDRVAIVPVTFTAKTEIAVA